MHDGGERGFSLTELLVVVAILMLTATWLIPNLRAYTVEAHILAAGRKFKSDFLKARSDAVRSNAYNAIRFEDCGTTTCYSVYRDGDFDGVLSDDITRGIDRRLSGPFPLSGGAPGVRVAVLPTVPAIPPDSGLLSASDSPIRFGRSRMISFSPFGTASPGTFYLAGDGTQGAVRVTPGTSRVRLMIWRGGPASAWKERP